MLTAVGYPDTSRPADPSTAYWWNLSAGTAGTVTVPAGGFVGADPNGVLYLTSGGYLKEVTPAGVTTVLSRPVRYRGSHLIGRSSGRGVVFSDYTGGRGPRARYVRFSHPNKLHKLDTKHSEFVGCGAVSAKYAACTRTGAPEDRARNAALFPLNGGKPIPANDSNEYIGGVALLGAKTLAWTRSHDSGNVGVCCRLATMTRGSHQRHVAKRTVWGGVTWPGIISAYGGVLAMGPERHAILETSDGKTFSTIVTAPSS
jgi:hypothetical protein